MSINNSYYTGYVTLLAGRAIYGYIGLVDGTGSFAMFYSPRGIAISTTGDLYVADCNNNFIRKISTTGIFGDIIATFISMLLLFLSSLSIKLRRSSYKEGCLIPLIGRYCHEGGWWWYWS